MQRVLTNILLLIAMVLLCLAMFSWQLLKAGYPMFARHSCEMVVIAVLCMTGATALGFGNSRGRFRSECRQCGYNLTGNTSGVCPECGTPFV